MYPRPWGRENTCEGVICAASVRQSRGLGWMACLIEMNCAQASSLRTSQTTLTGSGQKACGWLFLLTLGTRGQKKTAGVDAEAKPSMFLHRNSANPPFRPIGAGVA